MIMYVIGILPFTLKLNKVVLDYLQPDDAAVCGTFNEIDKDFN